MVSYEYFMDEMKEIEIPIFAEQINYAQAEEWQRMRWLMWATLKTSFKIKDPRTIFPLPTDDDYEEEEHVITVTNEQVNILKTISTKLSEEMYGDKRG